MEMRKRRERRQAPCIFPGYRWCGECSGPGAPVNDVDSCCRRHDFCISRGISPCECDAEFMNCLRPKIDPRTQKGRNAELMYRFMNVKTSLYCGHNHRRRQR
jgi:hypothetical protein